MSSSLRIAVAGTGRMGQAVEEQARLRGHKIAMRFNQANPVSEAALGGTPDVVIDFTQPKVAVSNITNYCATQVPAVIGTTGWYDQISEVHSLVESSHGAVLYSSNFSLGIQLVLHALQAVGTLLDQLPEFDVAIHELHHSEKLDAPSGTAINLADRLIGALRRKVEWGRCSAPHDSSKLEIVSTRIGHVFGQHRVMIDGPADHVVLEHTAKGREGFAMGAVRAAEWIQGHTGLFTLEDMLAEWLANRQDSDHHHLQRNI